MVKTCKPNKGKRFCKVVKGKKVSYGQKGASIKPGTKKGDSYCARSLGIKKKYPSARKKDSPNELSRKKWKCKGKKSVRK